MRERRAVVLLLAVLELIISALAAGNPVAHSSRAASLLTWRVPPSANRSAAVKWVRHQWFVRPAEVLVLDADGAAVTDETWTRSVWAVTPRSTFTVTIADTSDHSGLVALQTGTAISLLCMLCISIWTHHYQHCRMLLVFDTFIHLVTLCWARGTAGRHQLFPC